MAYIMLDMIVVAAPTLKNVLFSVMEYMMPNRRHNMM